MKNLRNRFFLLMLFCSSYVYSFEITDNQHIALKNIGVNSLIVGALGLSSYVAWTCNVPEEFYVKNSHPYAQVWYDEMAIKYPHVHFDQKRFLSGRRGLLDNSVSWESAYNDVYAPAGDLQRIHEIYKNKSENIEITENDNLGLCMCEFLLLHEAAHIKNKDSIGRLCAFGSLGMFMEIVTATYRATGLYNPMINTDYFGRDNHLDSYCGIAACFMGYIAYVRYAETRADEFACDNAVNIEVLNAGKTLFENIDIITAAAQDPNNEDYEFAQYIISHPSLRWIIDFLIDKEHPGLSIRAQNVQNEINRRLQTMTK